MEFVARPRWPRPTEFPARADNPPAGLSSLSTRSRMVNAAVCQPLAAMAAEERVSRGLLIEVERLGVELSGEGLDLIGANT